MRVAHLLTTLATATALRTTRRALGAGALTTALGPRPAFAADEWRLGVLKDYAVTKKQASSVRIRPETMLTATGENDTELKLLKVPLGRVAAASFAPTTNWSWPSTSLPERTRRRSARRRSPRS